MLTGITQSRSIPVSYSLTANISNGSSLNEGDSITYILTTTGLPDGTLVYWNNTGSTVATDFTQGINSGTLIINNNTASITLTLYEDYVTEGTETIVFNVMETQGGSVEDTMTHNVNDTTIAPGALRVTVGHTDISCNGGLTGELRIDSATGGNPPYTYTFKQGSQILQAGSATTLSGLAAGTYIIDVTDTSTGQYVAQTISQNEVILQPPSNISVTHSITTSSITVNPSGGTAGYTIYLFHHSGSPVAQQTTSGSAVTFTGLSSNTGYEYSIVDSAGCSIPNRISVSTGSEALSASITKTNVTCAGGSDGQITVNVSSGEYPYEYRIDNTPLVGSTAYNLTQGTYSITVTDNAGQQQSFPEIQIAQPDPISITAVSQTDTTIVIRVSGGSADYTYIGSAQYTQSNNDFTFTGLSPETNYQFTFDDSNGCRGTADISTDSSPLSFTEFILLTDQTCFYHPNISAGYGEIRASWTNGGGNITLQLFRRTTRGWSDDYMADLYTQVSVSGNTHTFTGLPAGYYLIGYTDGVENLTPGSTGFSEIQVQQPVHWVPNIQGHENSITVYVPESDPAIPNLTVTLYSNGSSVGSQTLTAKYGNQNPLGTVEQWVNNNPGMIAYFQNLNTENTYSVSITDSTGCTYTSGNLAGGQTPTNPALYTPSISIQQPNCHNDSATITASGNGGCGGYIYEFYKVGDAVPKQGFSSANTYTTNVAGEYYVIVKDSCNQTSNQSPQVTLINPDPISVLQTGSTTNSITLQISGGYPTYWISMNGSTQTANTPGQSITFNGLNEQQSTYSWNVSANGCVLTGTASKPTLTLYPAYTTTVLSAYQPPGAATFCDITSSANTNISVQVISENPYQLIGDYIRSSNGTPQTSFENGELIAISYTNNMAVPNDGGVWELTFGPNSEIIDVQTIACGTSAPGGEDPVFREDPME